MNIGLTQRIFYHKQRAYDGLEHGWYSFLKEHTLFPVSNDTTQDFKKIADSIELLIITGGNDPTVRRITETKLATEMMLRGKPILGICHGAFLLTNLLGGTVEDCSYHMDTEHKVYVGSDSQIVNSYHDYQITKLHDTATSVAIDEDGICEAWVDKNIAGVVWHPERMTVPYLPSIIRTITGL
jgi:gamma-glutamyl-gamma-aminobutyrate hydrolase PuuD